MINILGIDYKLKKIAYNINKKGEYFMESTVTAIIGGLCTAIPSILATITLNNKNQAIINTRLDENLKLIEYRINELSKKQDKYNNVLGRMAILENDQKNLVKELDSISERIK